MLIGRLGLALKHGSCIPFASKRLSPFLPGLPPPLPHSAPSLSVRSPFTCKLLQLEPQLLSQTVVSKNKGEIRAILDGAAFAELAHV